MKAPSIACIFLAAGLSSRMKGRNKLLMPIDHTSVVRQSALTLFSFLFTQKIAVVPENIPEVWNEISDLGFTPKTVADPSLGMHASIRKGLEVLDPRVDAFFIVLADQAFLSHEVFYALFNAYPRGKRDAIVFPEIEGERSQPVLIGVDFISEILAHPDGDFGCAYLIKRHPERCIPVPFGDEWPFRDLDTPEAFQKLQTDPVEAFHRLSLKLRQDRKPYVVATVIETMGSSSARPGSKAIFDEKGKNLLGWVGGGCAEQHVSQQCVEALKENQTRIIQADLDDEILGLGVDCGGKMNLFLEPVFPAEIVRLKTNRPEEAILFGKRYGWRVEPELKSSVASTPQENLFSLIQAIGTKRNKSLTSLRDQKELPVRFSSLIRPSSCERVTLIGSTRITESLYEHFSLLGFQVRIVGPLLKPYGKEDGPEIEIEPGERVIVASHTSQDSSIIAKMIKLPVSYLAMVGSRKRALEVIETLKLEDGEEVSHPLYVPAGFDIDARNPEEVALSIFAECLSVAPPLPPISQKH